MVLIYLINPLTGDTQHLKTWQRTTTEIETEKLLKCGSLVLYECYFLLYNSLLLNFKRQSLKHLNLDWAGMIFTTIIAATNVPNAWAKNGITKCFGDIKCIDFFNPSAVVKSVPGGLEINLCPFSTINIFNSPPINKPTHKTKSPFSMIIIFSMWY